MNQLDKQVKKVEVEGDPDVEAPAYSQEFLTAMCDYGYTTLQTYLESKGVCKEALVMLEDLFILADIRMYYLRNKKEVHWVQNLVASESIANLSQNVIKLGGCFISPSGIVLTQK